MSGKLVISKSLFSGGGDGGGGGGGGGFFLACEDLWRMFDKLFPACAFFFFFFCFFSGD